MDAKLPGFVASPEDMLGKCYAELMARGPVWKQRLLADPQALPELEREVQIQFIRGADLAVVGLVSWVM